MPLPPMSRPSPNLAAMTVYDSQRYALVNRWDPQHLKTLDRLFPLSAGERVLEVGCGSGHLTKRLAARGVDIVGIDPNPNAGEVRGDRSSALHERRKPRLR